MMGEGRAARARQWGAVCAHGLATLLATNVWGAAPPSTSSRGAFPTSEIQRITAARAARRRGICAKTAAMVPKNAAWRSASRASARFGASKCFGPARRYDGADYILYAENTGGFGSDAAGRALASGGISRWRAGRLQIGAAAQAGEVVAARIAKRSYFGPRLEVGASDKMSGRGPVTMKPQTGHDYIAVEVPSAWASPAWPRSGPKPGRAPGERKTRAASLPGFLLPRPETAMLVGAAVFCFSGYGQQADLAQGSLSSRGGLVADYLFCQGSPFRHPDPVRPTSCPVRSRYQTLRPRVAAPESGVYLQARAPRCCWNESKSGDARGETHPWEYLREVAKAYSEFFFSYNDSPLLIVDASEIDFVGNAEDRAGLAGSHRADTCRCEPWKARR